MRRSKPTQRPAGSTSSISGRDKAAVDDKYRSIIMAKSLTGDGGVLTVEPETENRRDKMRK